MTRSAVIRARINEVVRAYVNMDADTRKLYRASRRLKDWRQRDEMEKLHARKVQIVAKMDAHIDMLKARWANSF